MARQQHPAPTKKKVLFKIDTGTYYTGLVKVALALQDTGRFEPIMFFNNDHPAMDIHRRHCRQAGLTMIDGLPGYDPDSTQYNSALQRVSESPSSGQEAIGRPTVPTWRRLARRLRRQTQYHPLRQFFRLRRKLRDIEFFLTRQPVDMLVYGGENVWYDTALYNRVAHQRHIPTVALPQWMAGPREPAEHIFDDPAYSLHPAINRLVGWLWPKWVLHYQGKTLIRLPGQDVIARELLGLAPPLPWILHSGRTDVVAVENEAMRAYGLRAGLPESQLRVVGSLDHDLMAASVAERLVGRQRLMTKLGLEPNQPIALSAVPPNFLSGRSQSEFHSYEDLVTQWIRAIQAQRNWHVIFHAHPAATHEDLALMRSLGAHVIDQPIAELIPLVDIFIASVSSTIQWAIAAGLPVVNYDLYRYRYDDYDAAPGVVRIEVLKDFTATLSRLATDPNYANELRRSQQRVAAQWGQLDGQSFRRIVDLFETLIVRPPVTSNP